MRPPWADPSTPLRVVLSLSKDDTRVGSYERERATHHVTTSPTTSFSISSDV